MPIHFSSRPTYTTRHISAARILRATALMAFLATPPAFAVALGGRECTLTRYLSTATKVSQVGLSFHCAGGPTSSSGEKTRFFTVLTFRLPGSAQSPLVSCEIIDGQFTCTSHPANH